MSWMKASSIELAPVGSLPSSLHSTTAQGRPFTKSTMSGMIKFFTRPGVSTRNWLMAMKRLFSGVSQSTSFTSGYSSPVSSLLPTTTRVCPISLRVTISLASSRGLPATSVVNSSCSVASCASVSQGLPSGNVLMPRTFFHKHAPQCRLPKILSQALARIAGNAMRAVVDHLPAEGGELVEEGFFDVEVFGHDLEGAMHFQASVACLRRT